MKKTLILGLLIASALNSFSQSVSSLPSLVPLPPSMQTGTGSFLLKPTTTIEVSANDTDARRVAGYLAKKLATATGYTMPVRSATGKTARIIDYNQVS